MVGIVILVTCRYVLERYLQHEDGGIQMPRDPQDRARVVLVVRVFRSTLIMVFTNLVVFAGFANEWQQSWFYLFSLNLVGAILVFAIGIRRCSFSEIY